MGDVNMVQIMAYNVKVYKDEIEYNGKTYRTYAKMMTFEDDTKEVQIFVDAGVEEKIYWAYTSRYSREITEQIGHNYDDDFGIVSRCIQAVKNDFEYYLQFIENKNEDALLKYEFEDSLMNISSLGISFDECYGSVNYLT